MAEMPSPSGAEPTMTATILPELPTPLADPLRFTFPTSGAEPISLWRPPLYPVPWEPSPYDHFYFTRPIGANEVNWPLARYRYGFVLYSEPHTGIDIPAPKGVPVLAAGSGTVIWAGYGLYFMKEEYQDPYGIAVAIKHDFGYHGEVLYTVYGHMDAVYVYRGQRVESGQTLGIVGETGNVSGPHLHFEVRIGDNSFFVSRNPELWISPPEGLGVLAGRVLDGSGDPAEKVTVKVRSLEAKGNFETITYGKGAVNSDDYYRENMVLGDLPAGQYMLLVEFNSITMRADFQIKAGQVTFFTLKPGSGFDFTRPPASGPTFIPPDVTATPGPTIAP
jgi:murein DD-endopeptidase MepM/ murein hydrolase activator NlpD